jgi:hypothetical protein
LKLLAYSAAKEHVHKLNLRSSKDWAEYCKSGNIPRDIPYSPYRAYKDYWKGWSDWLGTITPREVPHRPFEKAREFVRKLNLKTREEWENYCKSGNEPKDIPQYPNNVYKNQWIGVGDWLGTNSVSNKEKQFLPFLEARTFVRALGLKNSRDWEKYRMLKGESDRSP